MKKEIQNPLFLQIYNFQFGLNSPKFRMQTEKSLASTQQQDGEKGFRNLDV